MSRPTLAEPTHLTVATVARSSLLTELQRAGVHLNASAQTLLEDPVFDQPAPQSVTLVERSLNDLGPGRRRPALAAGLPLRPHPRLE